MSPWNPSSWNINVQEEYTGKMYNVILLCLWTIKRKTQRRVETIVRRWAHRLRPFSRVVAVGWGHCNALRPSVEAVFTRWAHRLKPYYVLSPSVEDVVTRWDHRLRALSRVKPIVWGRCYTLSPSVEAVVTRWAHRQHCKIRQVTVVSGSRFTNDGE